MRATFLRLMVLAGVSTACIQSSLFAGVIRHDVNDSLYLDLASDSRYASVGRVTLQASDGFSYAGSGSLVASNWVLTAAHVVEDALNMQFHVGSSTYTAINWVHHPKWDGNLGRGYDIALMQLETDLSITPAALYQGTNERGMVGTFVGYGMTGTGLTGATIYDAQKRAGQNVIDVLFNTGGRTSRAFGADFDNPNGSTNTMGASDSLALEDLISFGDSGGGVFIDEDGSTYLAGVHSFGVDYNSNGLWSDYGDYTGHTRVSSHYQWIVDTINGSSDGSNNGKAGGNGGGKKPKLFDAYAVATIPEPNSILLCALGLLVLWQRRTVRN